MKKNNFSLNIETLILVAVFDHPMIFQGSFNITNTKNNTIQLLFFRCECSLKDKINILDNEFSPYDYKFTHLYDTQSEIDLLNTDDELEKALYLLKYALKETLQKMISIPNQHLMHIDEIAMSSIVRQINDHIVYRKQKKENDNIGFAVSIDFTPTEDIGNKAALTLLKIKKYSKYTNSLH